MNIRPLLIVLVSFSASLVFGQAPGNDNFANRYPIIGTSISTNGTTVNATREAGAGEPQINANNTHSVWYQWTPTYSASVTVGVSGTFRETLAVWTGNSVGALGFVNFSQAPNGGTSTSLGFNAVAGTTYSISVDTRGTLTGTFTLTLSQAPPPPSISGVTVAAYYTNPANATLSVNAVANGGGTVSNVRFYTNNVLLGTSPSSGNPYTFVWNSPAVSYPAVYSISAIVTDSSGSQTASSPTNTTVLSTLNRPVVRHGDVWKFLDDGTDQGVAWIDPGFNDSTWQSGASELGYGDAENGRPEATQVGFGGNPNNKFVTTYFRRSFVVTNAALITNLVARLVRDDGAAVYLNGTEIMRNNLAAGATATTLAPASLNDDGTEWVVTNVAPALLVNGTNVLAAEMHQNSLSSSDLSFDFDLIATVSPNAPPTVDISSPSSGQRFTPGTNITITANASDSDGTVASVSIYAGQTLLKTFTTPPYSFVWSNVAQGDYSLTAVALDNGGVSTVSAAVPISVNTFFVVPVTLVPTGSVWKYLDNGSDQGTAWQSFGFDDRAWLSGPAQLGYSVGTGNVENDEATFLSFGPDANNKWTNYYFRKFFVATNVSTISNLTIRLLRDDAAVVYINGTEVRRDNLPSPPTVITSTTVALGAVAGTDESTFFVTETNAALNNGTNVIAVEIHQNNGPSSDLSFDLELIANTIQGAQITNTIAPFVQSQNPPGGSSVSSLTSVQVTFSEAVTGVDAADLLVNGSPASGVSGNGNIYTFTFTQPAYGAVNFTWAGSHGIVDQGTPQLALNGAASSNTWSYNLMDAVAPTVVSKSPAAGASLTNLNNISVTWSENVQGVHASDMLVNGVPASGLIINSGSNYIFTFGQPQAGTINITWAGSHGIADTSPSANAFDANGAGATWSYTLSIPPTILIASNSGWRFAKGTNDATLSPGTAWRQVIFDETGWISPWVNSPTPFYYGDPYTNTTTGVGTLLNDMNGVYQCVLLRRTFVLDSPASVTNFIYRHQSDDGFVAWINGTEVLRYDMTGAPADPPYVLASGVQNAPDNNGAPYVFVTNSVGLSSLVAGTNVLTVQAFNTGLSGSTDFGINLQFEATMVNVDPTNLPPRILTVNPPSGELFYFTNLAVTFSERVLNVGASDLLVNGVPATGVTAVGQSNYTFTFAQPAYGNVNVTWANNHGIVDFDTPPKAFDGTAPGATFSYTLVNPNAPLVASQNPLAGSTVSNLTQVSVVFSKSVVGVDAGDLLINGAAATSRTGSGSNYTFTFTQPAYGNVAISWIAGHGISDGSGNGFDPARPGNTWQYTFIDRQVPTIVAKTPAAGANVTNLGSLNLTFSELVTGVNASDLLVNGLAATNVTGNGSNFTFSFAQPNQSVVTITWAAGHGIVDTAANAFDSAGAGATWQYFTPDNVAPVIVSLFPPPSSTVRSLSQVVVSFSEPVNGVSAGDLLVNNIAATSVSGSASGPYTFIFAQPATGAVEIAWAPSHGITDQAVPPNAFVGSGWNYVLDPNAVFAGKVVINEIMFQPTGFSTNDEWIELRSMDSSPINLNGWRFTRGVDFTFPNVTIPAGGYLVVAAKLDSFQTKYPSVLNVIGGWSGTLANNGENIRLETALDEEVDEVRYATEGDWATRYHIIPVPAQENTQYGWKWRTDADGLGKSLELQNPALLRDNGQNWRASGPANGTPGAVNSVASTNIAPIITAVSHFPVVPRSSDTVTISAKVFDEQPGLVVRAFYRNFSTTTPTAFVAAQMFDDGAHGDGGAGDLVFATTIPAQTNDTVIDFYVQAVDVGNRTNSWPAAVVTETNVVGQFANALFQVDDRTYSFAQPLYKFIMTEQERVQRDFIASSRPQSDAEMNTTFISVEGTGTSLRYNCGIRERGAGSRGYIPANHRVNIPNDRSWHDQTEMNLNTRFTESQYAGYLLSALAGADTEPARVVRVRLNNSDRANAGSPQFGCYVHLQGPGSEMAEVLHPNDPGGNVYRSTATRAANLSYPGSNPSQYQANYDKVSNQSENNWSDLIALTYALSPNTPNSNYTAAVRAVLNVEEWMNYFAINTLLVNTETALGSANDNSGDEVTIYFTPQEGRAYLVAHDWDSVLGQGDQSGNGSYNGTNSVIFRSDGLTAINRFMHWPEFQNIFYATLRRLSYSVFAPTNVSRTLNEHLATYVPQNVIDSMVTFAANRARYVLANIPADTNTPATLPASFAGGTLVSNVVLSAANSPYTISSAITVASGVTLTIQPGATVRFNSGIGLTVANGGRLIADGTAAAPILFTRNGVSGNWGNIVINGAVGSPESRISYARIEFNANTVAIDVASGTAVLDHLTFGNTAAPYIHVDGASFVISYCEFPSPTAAFEPVHASVGPKAGGRAIFYRNFFGRPQGYNDTVDFTGGNRPGSPIVQFLDNVFVGSDDDILDLDGTDAWVEGNIFLHVHRGAASPDSSSAVSGGNNGSDTSEITVVNNLFFDVDQAATAKQGNHYTFVNNTVVHQSSAAGLDAGLGAVLNFADDGIAQARGMFVEGNVMFDVERITRDVTNATPVANNTYFTNNLMPFAWAGPGGGNSTANPLIVSNPPVSTTFTNWASAQIMRTWFSLRTNSPGIATGFAGTDKGFGPIGAKISATAGATTNDAVFRVHFNRAGNGIPTAGFPNGSGYTAFKWRLDGGPWSAETPIASTVSIPGFFIGAHRFEVSGKLDSGTYQDDPDFGDIALTTSYYSKPTRVVQLNEILASNSGAVNHESTTPDVIELHNSGATLVDISGLRLTDDPAEPNKFVFPSGTKIPADGYLVVFANDPDGTSGLHAGFGLSKSGQSVYLYDKVDNGGEVIDSVTFGLQANNYSVGRLGTNWALCAPTFGLPNVAAAVGNPTNLYINEILTAEIFSFPDDFVEIANPQSVPVDMSGLFFSDAPAHWPNRSTVPALTFIEANAYLAFRADGKTGSGADHLSFALAAERGLIALLNRDYSIIDQFLYGPQTSDVSQGRVTGSYSQSNTFNIPTPGAINPGVVITNTGVVLNEILAANTSIVELDGTTPDWIELYNRSTNAVDLSGARLTDDTANLAKYVFPTNTTIAGRGYLRLRCDGGLPASATNTGFNIKAESGLLYFVSSSGGILDIVQYGLQAIDFSISRLPDGTGAWGLSVPTPSGANLAASLGSPLAVRVNEWMPAPATGEDWFELYNPSAQPVAIGGFYLSDDNTVAGRVKYPAIQPLSFLGASTNSYQRFWADDSAASGANHTSFKLNNTTEWIVFSTPSNTLVDQISYTGVPANVSEGRFPDGNATIVRFPGTASPNDPNYLLLTNVVINEALTHTDPPFEDAIELRNLRSTNVNIGGWWLSDAKSNLRKFRIPDNTIIPGNGYKVFYEYEFNNDPTNNPQAFGLSSHGDEIYLSIGDAGGNLTGYRTSVEFSASLNGISFGRYITSDTNEEFVAMSARSFGQDDPNDVAQFRGGNGLANPYPRVGPVVINKIMYHPPDINGTNDDTLNEFVELKNIGAVTQPLYDPAFPTNTWRLRDAIDYNFPQGVSMPAGSSLLLVSFDPISNPGQLANFRAKYAVDPSMPVYGPFTGKLANDQDKVELRRPDAPDLGEVPYVLVERVHYHDLLPWPTAPDGGGAALQRISVTGYGNDPTNWVAVVPNFGASTDTDGDGMPDWWEQQYGLSRFNPNDANQDLDGDGSTNLQEYLAGTDPTSSDPNNPFSTLRIRNVESLGGNNARLTFIAVSNKTYTVEFKNGLADPSWTRLIDVSVAPTNRTMLINTVVPTTNRFYRLRTPQAP